MIHSPGWPFFYKTPNGSCSYKIYKSNSYQKGNVVFMDVNIDCGKDYVQLYGKLEHLRITIL